jgi:hypothetical protein
VVNRKQATSVGTRQQARTTSHTEPLGTDYPGSAPEPCGNAHVHYHPLPSALSDYKHIRKRHATSESPHSGPRSPRRGSRPGPRSAARSTTLYVPMARSQSRSVKPSVSSGCRVHPVSKPSGTDGHRTNASGRFDSCRLHHLADPLLSGLRRCCHDFVNDCPDVVVRRAMVDDARAQSEDAANVRVRDPHMTALGHSVQNLGVPVVQRVDRPINPAEANGAQLRSAITEGGKVARARA